jgi:hypothetical protein
MKLNLLLISGISFLLLQSIPGYAQAPGQKPKYDAEKANVAWKAARSAADSGNYDMAANNLLKVAENSIAAKGEKFADVMLKAVQENLEDYMRKAEERKDWPAAERMANYSMKYYELVGDKNSAGYRTTANELKFVQRLLGKSTETIR